MAEDVRRRRAEKVRQERMKTMLPRYKWYLIIGGILIVVLVAAAAFPGLIPQGAPPKQFVHKHASFSMFVNNEEVSFANPEYDHGKLGATAHFHFNEAGGGHVFHIEGSFPAGNPDLTLDKIWEPFGVIVKRGEVKLDTHDGHNGSTWRDTGNLTWKVYVSKYTTTRGPFVEVQDYMAYAPQEFDLFLMTYGNPTPEQLAAQQASIPEPPGTGTPGVMPS